MMIDRTKNGRTKMFDDILNWKLLEGSHEFPGQDGGTCINEAAIVAAGYKYKSVDRASDCPPCFSRVIASYALALNDTMADAARQEFLMPFVTRLAGTADTYKVEAERIKHIVCSVVRRILPIALNQVGLLDQANRCARWVTSPSECASVADAAYRILSSDDYRYVGIYTQPRESEIDEARNCATSALRAVRTVYNIDEACSHAANSIACAYRASLFMDRDISVTAVAILDEAIRLGNQATPVEVALVVSRMEAAKRVVEHA
jgi:hypothetical protein